MAYNESPGNKFRDQQEFGVLELEHLQASADRARRKRRLANSSEHGFLLRPTGNSNLPDFAWTLYDRDGDGILRIKTYETPDTDLDPRDIWIDPDTGEAFPKNAAAVEADGHTLEIPLVHDYDVDITVPNDGVDYTILVHSAADRQLAHGTLTLTGSSTTISGVNTRFTEMIGKSDSANPVGVIPRGTKLRIDVADSGAGNEGVYELDTVISDTSATLVSAPPATEAGVPFRVAGSFLSAPATEAEKDIHNVRRVEFELVSDVIGAKSADGLIAFRVRRQGGTTRLIDRRGAQLWRPFASEPRGWVVQPLQEASGPNGLLSAVESVPVLRSLSTTSVSGTGLARRVASCRADEDGATVLFLVQDSLGNIEAGRLDPSKAPGANMYESYPYVAVENSGSAEGVAVIQLPAGDPLDRTHLAFYVESDDVYMQASTDHGLTWGSKTRIWESSAVYTTYVSDVEALVTHDLRILVTISASAGTSTLRYVYSDTLGISWSVNSNNGYELITSDGPDLLEPCMVQDDGGNIYTAYTQHVGSGGEAIRLVRGATPNNPAPAPNVSGTQADEEVSGSPYQGEIITPPQDTLSAVNDVAYSSPSLWCSPDGGIVCVYSASSDGGFAEDFHYLWASSVSFRRSGGALTFTTQINGWDAGGGYASCGGYLCQTPDGRLNLIGSYINGSTDPIFWVPLLALPLPRGRSGWARP